MGCSSSKHKNILSTANGSEDLAKLGKKRKKRYADWDSATDSQFRTASTYLETKLSTVYTDKTSIDIDSAKTVEDSQLEGSQK